MTPATLDALLEARAQRCPVVLATRLTDGVQHVLPGTAVSAALAEAAGLALERDENGVADIDGEAWFLHVHARPWRLFVVGAVHIAQVLVPLAHTLGYAVTVIDPRASFNSAERFPGAERMQAWPDTALDTMGPDARSAVVAMTHDPKLDDPALDRALRSPASYIGALGSKRSHAARLTRLGALGHSTETLARVRGPVGLKIGAVSAPEISLSIMAEIVAVRRHADLGERR